MGRDSPGHDSMCLMDTSVQQAARRNTVAVTVPAGLGLWVPGSRPVKTRTAAKAVIPGPAPAGTRNP